MPEVRIDCSDFNYWDWKENFYGYAPSNAKELIGIVK